MAITGHRAHARWLVWIATTARFGGVAILTGVAMTGRIDAQTIRPPSDNLLETDLSNDADSRSIELGRTNPSWSVTPQGAFTYTIPIDVPPGRKGMQPAIALTYSSLSGNGLLGVGWSITGIPTISRIVGAWGINYSGRDAYAFNSGAWAANPLPGDQLIEIAPGVYHTIVESWRDLRPSGSCGDGPCTWTLRDGTGKTYYFGGAQGDLAPPATQWERGNGELGERGIQLWALYKVVDPYGNSYRIEYIKPGTSRTARHENLYPLRIVYSGHEKQIVPVRMIEFSYESRVDLTPAPFLLEWRLTSITTRADTLLVHRFLVTYGSSPASARSRVDSIQVFGSDLVQAYPAMVFSYEDGIRKGIRSLKHVTGPYTGVPIVGDFNGDGRKDIATVYQGPDGRKIEYALGTPDGLGPVIKHTDTVEPGSVVLEGNWIALTADVNGDGKDDLVLVRMGPDKIATAVAFGSASGLGPLVDPGNARSWGGGLDWYSSARVLRTDINGDHRTDLVFVHPELPALAYAFGLDNGFSPIVVVADSQSTDHFFTFGATVGDFNGDGRGDVFMLDRQTSQSRYALGTFSNFGPVTANLAAVPVFSHPSSVSPRAAPILSLDVTGDGRADVVVPLSPTEIGTIFGETGGLSNKFSRHGIVWLNPPLDESGIVTNTGDWNGDGIGDVLLSHPDGSTPANWYHSLFIGSSDGVIESHQVAFSTPSFFLSADLDGVGRSSLVFMTSPAPGMIQLQRSFADHLDLGAPGSLSAPEPGKIEDFIPSLAIVADLNGDGINDLILFPLSNSADHNYRLLLSNDRRPDLLRFASNGLGGVVKVEYTSAPNASKAILNSTIGCGELNPSPDTSRCSVATTVARPLVTRVSHAAGRGDIRSVRYVYENGRNTRFQRFDDNDLGFERVTRIDEQAGTEETTDYRQDWPFQRNPKQRAVFSSKGTILFETFQYRLDQPYGQGSRLVRVTSHLRQELDGDLVTRQTTTAFVYGDYGSVTMQTECDGTNCQTTRNFYTNDFGNWILRRLDASQKVVGDGTKDLELRLVDERHEYAADGFSLSASLKSLCRSDIACLCPRAQPCSSALARSVVVIGDVSYDDFGNVTSSRDARGYVTTHTYDLTSGQVLSTTRHILKPGILLPYAESKTYDNAGRLSTDTDVSGHITKHFYDVLGRRSRSEFPNGRIERYEYLSLGDPQSQNRTETHEGAGPAVWKRAYFDGDGQVYRNERLADGGLIVSDEHEELFVNGLRVVRSTRPHFAGQPTSTIEHTYDEAGRLARIDEVIGTNHTTVQSFTYSGLQVQVQDALLRIRTATYGNRGELTSRHDASGITSYCYDEARRLSKVVRPNGQSTSFTYDSWGRQASQFEAPQGVVRFEYDDVGDRISVRNGEGKLTTSTFDEVGRLTSVTDSSGTIKYSYDGSPGAFGRLSKVEDKSGSTQFQYDLGGNAIHRIVNINGYPSALDIAEEYDALNRIRARTFPDGFTVRYEYSVGGNLASVSVPQGTLAAFQGFNASGKPAMKKSPSTDTKYEYDNEDRLSNLTITSGTKLLVREQYSYDRVDNLVAVVDHRPMKKVGAVNTDSTQYFNYDGLDRLRVAKGAYGSRTYTYDGGGNVTKIGNVSVTYKANEIEGQNLSSKVFREKYDHAGNLKSRIAVDQFSYQYDDSANLRSVTMARKPVFDSEYNYLGERVKRVSHLSRIENVTTYSVGNYDIRLNSSAAGKRSITRLIDAPGLGLVAVVTTGTLPHQPSPSQLAGASRSPLSSTIISGPPPGVWFYHENSLHSVILVTSATGNTVSRLLYEPYGLLNSSKSVGVDIATRKFAGHEIDSETGLGHFGSRYYNAETGRFITAERLGPERYSSLQAPEAYSYASNNPLRYLDPQGTDFVYANRSWYNNPGYIDVNVSVGFYAGLTIGYFINPWTGLANFYAGFGIMTPTLAFSASSSVSAISPGWSLQYQVGAPFAPLIGLVAPAALSWGYSFDSTYRLSQLLSQPYGRPEFTEYGLSVGGSFPSLGKLSLLPSLSLTTYYTFPTAVDIGFSRNVTPPWMSDWVANLPELPPGTKFYSGPYPMPKNWKDFLVDLNNIPLRLRYNPSANFTPPPEEESGPPPIEPIVLPQ